MSRAIFERACRVTALAALAWALRATLDTAGAAAAPPRTLRLALDDSLVADGEARAVAALGDLVRTPRRDTAVMVLRALPSVALRAAIGALAASETPARWVDSAGARGLALSVGRSSAPGATLQVRATGQAGRSLVLRDAGGVLDSLAATADGHSWQLRGATAPLELRQGRSRAALAIPDSSRAQRVLVMAQPGWEGKFVVAALEEAGWTVDGTMRVSPTGAVTIGAPQRPDLARYAAVVVVDSMAVDAAALTAFVARGGGLLLGGDAIRITSLAALRPARAMTLRGGIAGALLTPEPRRGLDAWALATEADAVVLLSETSDRGRAAPVLVAARRGRGRAVAMAYRDTWRWRMQGTNDGMAQHRQWWQSALAAAVPAAAVRAVPSAGLRTGSDAATSVRDALPGPAAPYADLVARAGEPVADSLLMRAAGAAGDERGPRGELPRTPFAAVLLYALVALLAEWTSRRLRGVR